VSSSRSDGKENAADGRREVARSRAVLRSPACAAPALSAALPLVVRQGGADVERVREPLDAGPTNGALIPGADHGEERHEKAVRLVVNEQKVSEGPTCRTCTAVRRWPFLATDMRPTRIEACRTDAAGPALQPASRCAGVPGPSQQGPRAKGAKELVGGVCTGVPRATCRDRQGDGRLPVGHLRDPILPDGGEAHHLADVGDEGPGTQPSLGGMGSGIPAAEGAEGRELDRRCGGSGSGARGRRVYRGTDHAYHLLAVCPQRNWRRRHRRPERIRASTT
jgi:hypothetical protein